jgi:hypothetical protein
MHELADRSPRALGRGTDATPMLIDERQERHTRTMGLDPLRD